MDANGGLPGAGDCGGRIRNRSFLRALLGMAPGDSFAVTGMLRR